MEDEDMKAAIAASLMDSSPAVAVANAGDSNPQTESSNSQESKISQDNKIAWEK